VNSLDHSKSLILQNLNECNIGLNDLKNMAVLNVGTGREAIVFANLGAREVIHFDIVEKGIESLERYKNNKPTLNVIRSYCRDVCQPFDGIYIEKIDFVYLNGVLHHLHSPSKFVRNISPYLHEKSKLFFRIYNGGSFHFFVIDFIKKIIRSNMKPIILKKLPEDSTETGSFYTYNTTLLDHFMVPTLKLFDVMELDDYWRILGAKAMHPTCFKNENHEEVGLSTTGISLFYQMQSLGPHVVKEIEFPKHKDQLWDVSFESPEIQKTVKHIKQFLGRLGELTDDEIVDLSLECYELAYSSIFVKSSTEERHQTFRRILRTVLPEM
jgi:2-polyprenyl-3-methyl-5-hydroxy-6-metoxy-1,4-benzoquinol methylase